MTLFIFSVEGVPGDGIALHSSLCGTVAEEFIQFAFRDGLEIRIYENSKIILHGRNRVVLVRCDEILKLERAHSAIR